MNEQTLQVPSRVVKKACVACAGEIPALAKKCVHCGGYQDWRRYIDIGNTSLALIIALLTVIGLLSDRFISIYADLMSANKPSVVKWIQFIDEKKLTIVFSNIGKSRALIEGGVLCQVPIIKRGIVLLRPDLTGARNPNANEIEASNVMSFTLSNGNQMIEPGLSLIADYKLLDRFPQNSVSFRPDADAIPGYCHVEVRDIHGKHHSEFIPFSAMSLYFLQEPLRKTPRVQATESN